MPCFAHFLMELWDAREKIWPGQHAVPVVFALMMWMFHRCIEKELLEREKITTVGFVAVLMDLTCFCSTNYYCLSFVSVKYNRSVLCGSKAGCWYRFN